LIPIAGLTLSSAKFPTPVFEPPGHVLGHCAWSSDGSANQQSAIDIVKTPQRNDERLLDLISSFIFL